MLGALPCLRPVSERFASVIAESLLMKALIDFDLDRRIWRRTGEGLDTDRWLLCKILLYRVHPSTCKYQNFESNAFRLSERTFTQAPILIGIGPLLNTQE